MENVNHFLNIPEFLSGCRDCVSSCCKQLQNLFLLRDQSSCDQRDIGDATKVLYDFGITPGMISIMSGRKVSSIFWVLATAIESMIKARRIPEHFQFLGPTHQHWLGADNTVCPVCSFIKSIATSFDPSPWTRSACTMAHFSVCLQLCDNVLDITDISIQNKHHLAFRIQASFQTGIIFNRCDHR